MARRIQTVKRRARFVSTGYSADEMLRVARLLRDDIEARILRAENVSDSPAPPLSDGKRGRGYRSFKARRAPPAIRNWRFTGRTLRAMIAFDAVRNRAKIGFQGALANKLASINNRRHRQFGVSPRNRQVISAAFRRIRFVQVQAA
jgi:hypothetical protein